MNDSHHEELHHQQQHHHQPPLCYTPETLEIIPSSTVRHLLIGLYFITSLSALLGNVLVLVVQFFGTESAKNIRKYLINLAISDLIVGVLCIPYSAHSYMHRYWVFPAWLCPTAQFCQLLGVFVTSMTLMIIGVERYFFALHPLSRLHSHWLQNHGHVFLLITWAVGALYAYFPLQYTSIVEIIVVSSSASSLETSSESAFSNFTDVPEIFTTTTTSYYQCSYRENGLSANQRRLFLISNLLLTFAIPCLTLTFSYISIIRKLLHDQRRILASMNSTPVMYSGGSGNGSTNENSKSNSGSGSGRGNSRVFSAMNGGFKSSSKVKIRLPSPTVRRIHKRQLNYIQTRLKTIRIMFTVIILYCACWMPIKVYQFLHEYDLIRFCTKGQFFAIVYTYIACHWLAMANSFVNPIVYSFMSKSFRNDLRRIFKL